MTNIQIETFEKFNKMTLSYFENKYSLNSGARLNFCNNFDYFINQIKDNHWEIEFIKWLNYNYKREDYLSLKYYYPAKIFSSNEFSNNHMPTLLIMLNLKEQLCELLDMGYKLNDKEYALMYIPFTEPVYNNKIIFKKIVSHLQNYPPESIGELFYNYSKYYINNQIKTEDYTTLLVKELFDKNDLFMTNRMIKESIENSRLHYGSPSFLFFLHRKYKTIFENLYNNNLMENLHTDAFQHFLSSSHTFSEQSLEIIKQELINGFNQKYIFPFYVMPNKKNFSSIDDIKNYELCEHILATFMAKHEEVKLNSLFSDVQINNTNVHKKRI